MVRFRVTVPFEPIEYDSIGSSTASRLNMPLTIGGLSIHELEDGEYEATTLVDAVETDAAKMAAARRVEEFLWILAARGSGFRVRYFYTRVERDGSDTFSFGEGKPHGLVDFAFATDRIEVIKRQMHFDDEQMWIAALPGAAQRVLDAIEVNYLAMQATRAQTRIAVTMAALERLASGRQKELLQKLSKERREQLRDELVAVLGKQEYFLNDSDVARIVAQAFRTSDSSVANYLFDYLNDLGVVATVRSEHALDVDRQMIARWWKIRSSSAHGSVQDSLETEGGFNQSERHGRLAAVRSTVQRAFSSLTYGGVDR
jgi:hypothetical protein